MKKPAVHRCISRRKLLRAGGLAAMGGFLGPAARAAPAPLEKRVIPASDEALPVIGLGTSRVFDIGTAADERAACREVLAALLDAGATLVDSSPMYRRAEGVSGDLAADLGVTDEVFWATKVWADGRESGIEQMQQSMARFRTDHIELMQIHNLRDWQTQIGTLRDWQQAGRIRYIGLTISRAAAFDQMEKVIRETQPEFVQLNYSLGECEAENRLLPLCADQGIATLINRPFMRGKLFAAVAGRSLPAWAGEVGIETWAQFFLKFILGHPGVTCAIPATADARHMRDNLAAGRGAMPDQAQRQAMIDELAKT